jgi:hypothetical protein
MPKSQSLARREYGAFTFASKLNFCRGVRWIMSGAMASLWPDEPDPVFVRRGTPVEVLAHEHVECGELDDRLSVVTGDLIHYRPVDGSEDRYVLESDVYSAQQYKEYSNRKRGAPLAVESQDTRLPRVNVPPPIWLKGYEGGLSDIVKAVEVGRYISGESPRYPSYCNTTTASRYVDAAKSAFEEKSYNEARMYAYGAEEATGKCLNNNHPALIEGDGFLLMSKAELRLGIETIEQLDPAGIAGEVRSSASATTGQAHPTEATLATARAKIASKYQRLIAKAIGLLGL